MEPLATRIRPKTLDEFIGQEHLAGNGKPLREAVEKKHLFSFVLWGPPGVGKTTLARIYARALDAELSELSAVSAGKDDIKKILKADTGARQRVLFLDEIHRFNKAQQDALLPHVERGTITLIGATTENPSFEVNSALLSRCKTLVLEPLDDDALAAIIDRALTDVQKGLGELDAEVTDGAQAAIIDAADGDARIALNTVETSVEAVQAHTPDGEPVMVATEDVEEALQRKVVRYDKEGEEHYNVVSAFIKSMRGSDPDAALYYMNRMLEGGEDPLFILRRMIIFASEDVGNADPDALQVATSALQAFQFIGMPEGTLPMTQAVTYLATAPKSNAVIASYGKARSDAVENGNLPVPKKLLNAPTDLHDEMGHGRGYKYPHNFSGNYVAEDYLPDELQGRTYYEPSDNGYEQQIKERLEAWRDRGDEDDERKEDAEPFDHDD